MGRMASMQVLNQAFANANAAFNAYMRNKNEERRSDLAEEFGRLDRQYRAEQALQQQANLDRMYELAVNRDAQQQSNLDRTYNYNAERAAQQQANWEKTFNASRSAADSANRANKMRIFSDILKVAPDAGTASTMISQMGAGFDDPVVQGAFLNDYYNNKKLSDFGKQLDDYQSFASKLQLARAKQRQQELSEQRKYDVEMAKIKQAEDANALKNAIPYLTGKMQISSNENPYNADKAVDELNMVRAKLNGAYAPNNGGQNATQVPYALGENTKEDEFKNAKRFF